MGDLYRSNIADIDISKPLRRENIGALLAEGDALANRYGANVFRGDDPVDLTGYKAECWFIRPSKDTLLLDCVIDGNTVYVDLPAECYNMVGMVVMTFKLVKGDVTTTIRIVDGYVRETQTDVAAGETAVNIIEAVERAEAAADRAEEAANGSGGGTGSGTPGQDGEDGFSPVATVTQTSTGATISITDKSGTTTATITNGADGQDGQNGADGKTPVKGVDYFDGQDGTDGKDGVSPTVTVSKNGKVTTLTITDAAGTKTATINDGADGTDGAASAVPDYVMEEAERVAVAVNAARTAQSLVLLCASDIHTLQSNAQSVETTLHLAQGMSEICKRIAVDGIAILGDSAFGSSTSTAEETKFAFAYLRENLAKGVHEIWIPGNHDHMGIGTDSSYLSADELYSYIGANTTDKAVTDYDNLYRMYGYVDYDKQRIRVIYLNTSDITDSYASDYGMTTVQAQWFADTLAAVPSGWGVVVMSHHPLNGYISAYLGTLTLLDAYKGKGAGSVTVGGGTVAYDFADAQGEFICHLHGHIHNYQVKWLGDNGILSVTIPNGYFWRNNEYGTGGNTDWGDEVDGEQRVIDKTAGTAEDTAYTAVVIDRKGGKVYALRCGAGVDRVWDYVNGVEVDGETPDVPVEPDEPDTPTAGYTNQIPISVDTSGNVYNETGYKAGYRISTSAGTESAASGMTVTGYIPLPNTDSVVRVKDIDLTSSNSTFGLYSDAFVYGGGGYCSSTFGAADANGVRSYQVSTSAKYIRISGAFGDNPIITVDEEITD